MFTINCTCREFVVGEITLLYSIMQFRSRCHMTTDSSGSQKSLSREHSVEVIHLDVLRTFPTLGFFQEVRHASIYTYICTCSVGQYLLATTPTCIDICYTTIIYYIASYPWYYTMCRQTGLIYNVALFLSFI